MAHKHYQDLIEIQSIDREIKKHLDTIESNNQRIEFLNKQRGQKDDYLQGQETLLKNSTKETSDFEKQLSLAESKIEKSHEHLLVATNQQQIDAINKELEILKPQAQEAEDKVLELMELIDQLAVKINEAKTFLAGSLETLNELQEEVKTIVEEEESKIQSLDKRIENLLTLIPLQFKDIFLRIQEKHRFNNPLAFIKDKSCNQCRFAIDLTIQDNVTRGSAPEQCPSCGRLMINLSSSTSGG